MLKLLIFTEFVTAFYHHAKEVERMTGLPANIILTQAAVESNWGRSVSGFNYFGIKDIDGINGNEQLCKTVEYHPSPCWGYPEVVSVTKRGAQYRYIVMAYFRSYQTPMDSFVHFASIIERNFPTAWKYRCDGRKYFKNLNGYATSPTALTLHLKVLGIINREIYELELLQSLPICEQVWIP